MSNEIVKTKTIDDLRKELESEGVIIKDYKPETNVVPIVSNSNIDSIKVMTYEEMIKDIPGKVEMAIEPWLPIQGIAFIYAATGVGKTMFTLNSAYAAANGGKFLKFSSPKPLKVLYVDGEMAYKELHERFMQIVKQQGELTFPENWNLLTPDKALPLRLPKICDSIGQAFYNKKITELGIKVLILDNLSTLSAIDENNSEQWKIIQDWLIYLRSNGITVIVVHHAGKDKMGYRGTSRMLDCANTAISLQDLSDGELENEKSNIKKFKIEFQKSRGFSSKEAYPFEATFGDGKWEHKSIEITTTHRIIEMLKLEMTHKEIALELGFTRSYVSRLVRNAIKEGLIRKDNKP